MRFASRFDSSTQDALVASRRGSIYPRSSGVVEPQRPLRSVAVAIKIDGVGKVCDPVSEVGGCPAVGAMALSVKGNSTRVREHCGQGTYALARHVLR